MILQLLTLLIALKSCILRDSKPGRDTSAGFVDFLLPMSR